MIKLIITACQCHPVPCRLTKNTPVDPSNSRVRTSPGPVRSPFPGHVRPRQPVKTRHYHSHRRITHHRQPHRGKEGGGWAGRPDSTPPAALPLAAAIKPRPRGPGASVPTVPFTGSFLASWGREEEEEDGVGAQLEGDHGGRREGPGARPWDGGRGQEGGGGGGGKGDEGQGRQEGARLRVRPAVARPAGGAAHSPPRPRWPPVAGPGERAFGGGGVVGARVRREPGAVAVRGRRRGGGGGRGGAGRCGRGGRVVVAQHQRGRLRRRRGLLPRQRRRRRRLGAQEAAPVQGAVRVPGGELQGARHAEPEAEAGAGEAAQPPAAAGGGVVPEPPGQDEAEADGGGLRVPEALLRDADGGEPAAAQGAGRAPRAQGGAPILHAPPRHHPLHVPLLRARRLQLRPWGPGARGRRHCAGVGAQPSLVVRRALLLVPLQPRGGRPDNAAAGAGELVRMEGKTGPACKYAHLFFSSCFSPKSIVFSPDDGAV